MYHIKHYGEDNLPKNGKLLAKKSSIAHQNAPIDYISPWQAQHHIHLINSQNGQNIQHKNKFSEQKQKVDNVVSSFLQKIRKSSKLRGKQAKLIKNFSLDQQQSTNNNSFAATLNTNTPIIRKMKRESLIRNRTYDQYNYQKQSANIDGVQNVGFGFLKYSKHNLQKQYSFLTENNEAQRKMDMVSSQSQHRKFSEVKNSPNSPTFYLPTQKQQQQLVDIVELKSRDQIIFLRNCKIGNSKKRIFTQQQKQKPEQVIFVKKKKQNNKMTVVDINSTAQQFYDEEIKYIQDNMTKKYGKKAKSQIGKNNRYFTQETAKYNQTIYRDCIQRSLMRSKMNQTGYAHSIISKRKII